MSAAKTSSRMGQTGGHRGYAVVATFLVLLVSCALVCDMGWARDIKEFPARHLITGDGYTSLPPELAYVDGCTDPNPNFDKVLWYSISPAGDSWECEQTDDAFTPGVFNAYGVVVRYPNTTYDTDIYNVGARYGYDFAYIFQLQANCTYDVELQFREFVHISPESRVFNVYANNQLVVKELDIFKQTGSRVVPLVIPLNITIAYPALSLAFTQVRGDVAEISKVTITSALAPCPALPPGPPLNQGKDDACVITANMPPRDVWGDDKPKPVARLNVGGKAMCRFDDDDPTAVSAPSTTTTKDASTPGVKNILLSYRFARTFNYTFSVVPGSKYFLRLIMTEPFCTLPGCRIFNVFINDRKVVAALDLWSAAGDRNQPYVYERVWNAPAGTTAMVIRFQRMFLEAIVSSIELYQL